jgi:hypothetical protein
MKKFFKWVGVVLGWLAGFGFICNPCRILTMGIGRIMTFPFAQSLQCFLEWVF